jgi:hypothetical protein
MVQKMSTVPVQVLCSRNTTPWAFGRVLAEDIGLGLPRGAPTLHLLEIELARKMIIPRILELEQRNRRKLADGTVKMNEVIKVAAARLMV